jgi:hypothetical protein
VGIAASNPTEEEARGLYICRAEHIEKPHEVTLHHRWQRFPHRKRWSVRQIQDMKPIFNVYGKDTLPPEIDRLDMGMNCYGQDFVLFF